MKRNDHGKLAVLNPSFKQIQRLPAVESLQLDAKGTNVSGKLAKAEPEGTFVQSISTGRFESCGTLFEDFR